MKKKIILFTILLISLTGCTKDYYEDPSFGEKAVKSWFSYKNGDDNLGQTRLKQENIDEIKNVECTFVEKDKYKRYIFDCEITYTPIGETVIPLSKDKTMNVYVLFVPNSDGTYEYKVYNSSYEKGIWENDPDINYNEKRK